jgi:crossover junction endodeoxyribonuclease RusA
VLPVEFFVQGTPISHQSQNKGLLEDWREKVAAAARVQIRDGAAVVESPVELHVVYYFSKNAALIPDEDNLLKPIQDALREVIYADDDQVMDGTCRKRDINGEFRVRYMSPVLAQAFVAGDEFVHIVVQEQKDPRDLTP